MAFSKKGSWKKQPQQQEKKEQTPTFTIKESDKAGTPYAIISGRVSNVGRAGAMLMLFPSKFEGQFAGLSINGWGRGMIPVAADQIDIDGDTLKIDLGFLKIQATGQNTEELAQFLEYVANMPRERGAFQRENSEKEKAPAKKPWKK